MRHVRAQQPDVVVTDIRMPPTHSDEGLQAAKLIRAEHPGVGVLLLSQHVEQTYALELLGTSVRGTGYLLKDRISEPRGFAAAVRDVGCGRRSSILTWSQCYSARRRRAHHSTSYRHASGK
jgi:DNA-binding NarL/FixJ family response regulator